MSDQVASRRPCFRFCWRCYEDSLLGQGHHHVDRTGCGPSGSADGQTAQTATLPVTNRENASTAITLGPVQTPLVCETGATPVTALATTVSVARANGGAGPNVQAKVPLATEQLATRLGARPHDRLDVLAHAQCGLPPAIEQISTWSRPHDRATCATVFAENSGICWRHVAPTARRGKPPALRQCNLECKAQKRTTTTNGRLVTPLWGHTPCSGFLKGVREAQHFPKDTWSCMAVNASGFRLAANPSRPQLDTASRKGACHSGA